MDIFSFGREHGLTIEAYGSAGARVVHLLRQTLASVVTLSLEPGGLLGMHPAAADQLFLVVAGSGEAVAGNDVCPLSPGTAVLWRQGEEHETRAGSDGLTAVVVEGDQLAEALLLEERVKDAVRVTV